MSLKKVLRYLYRSSGVSILCLVGMLGTAFTSYAMEVSSPAGKSAHKEQLASQKSKKHEKEVKKASYEMVWTNVSKQTHNILTYSLECYKAGDFSDAAIQVNRWYGMLFQGVEHSLQEEFGKSFIDQMSFYRKKLERLARKSLDKKEANPSKFSAPNIHDQDLYERIVQRMILEVNQKSKIMISKGKMPVS